MGLEKLIFLLSTIKITDIIDILIVSYVFYKLFVLIRGTRATQLIKGILFIFIFSKLSEIFKLYTINWILSNALTVGVIAILIVFQPELRRVLEYIGNNKLLKSNVSNVKTQKYNDYLGEIIKASYSLGEKRIGALIVLEMETGLKDVVETGILLNSNVSYELLMNIFIPNTPLHDGAVIVSNGKIVAASCFLPLTDNKKISMELGTRHRAALGISEKSDCIVIVVSEETGYISLCERGKINRDIGVTELTSYLRTRFEENGQSTLSFKNSLQNILLKLLNIEDSQELENIDNDENIKEKIKQEVKNEVKEELIDNIKEEVSDLMENKGDKVEK